MSQPTKRRIKCRTTGDEIDIAVTIDGLPLDLGSGGPYGAPTSATISASDPDGNFAWTASATIVSGVVIDGTTYYVIRAITTLPASKTVASFLRDGDYKLEGEIVWSDSSITKTLDTLIVTAVHSIA